MATWDAPLPSNGVVAGDPGHPEMHNQIVDAITEVRSVVDGVEATAEAAPAWGDVTGKPAVIAAGSTKVAARDAIGAGTGNSNLALGTTATTAAAGNHTHAGLLSGTASSVPDSEATDVAGVVADFNALLAVLRTRGVLSA